MLDVLTVDAMTAIALLATIEAAYPLMRCIHVFLDNARYHHAKAVQEWLARPECRRGEALSLRYISAEARRYRFAG